MAAIRAAERSMQAPRAPLVNELRPRHGFARAPRSRPRRAPTVFRLRAPPPSRWKLRGLRLLRLVENGRAYVAAAFSLVLGWRREPVPRRGPP